MSDPSPTSRPALSGPGRPGIASTHAAETGAAVPTTWPSSHTVVLVVLWAGVALRVLEYLVRRSLWIDEAVVALSVGMGSPVALLSGGHRFLFLWAEWVATRVGGMNELALRALPFAAGLALLPAFRRLASRLLEVQVTGFALALAALSPALVYYANEAKPYGIDALVTVLLTGCAFDVLDTAGSRAAWLRLLLAGGLALLISIPAAFLLAGIGIALASAPQVRRRPEAPWRLALAGVLWAVALGGLYLVRYRATAADPYFRWWWAGGFLTPRSPEFLTRTWVAARTMMGEYFVGGRPEIAAVVLAGLAYLAGLVAIGRRRGLATVLVLAGPIAAALAASAWERYPVAPRTMLFALPLVMLTLAAGVAWLVERLRPELRPAALGLAGVVCLTPALGADLDRITRPELPEAPRPVIEEFTRRDRAGEPVYVFAHGVPAWLVYTTDWAAPDTARLLRLIQWASPPSPESVLSPGRSVHDQGHDFVYRYGGRCEVIGIPAGMDWRLVTGYDRGAPAPGWADNEATRLRAVAPRYVWLFFSHSAVAERTALLEAVQRTGGRLVYRFEVEGAELYRYRFATAPTSGVDRRATEVRPAASSGPPCDATPWPG